MLCRVGSHDVFAYTGSRLPDPSAPNLVFVHGAASDHSVFALQSRYFANGVEASSIRSLTEEGYAMTTQML